jgi:hypothetical protein
MSLAMPFRSSRQRVSRRRAEEKADQLMFDFGDEAYGEARRYERESVWARSGGILASCSARRSA